MAIYHMSVKIHSRSIPLCVLPTRKEDLDLFEGYVLMKQKHGEWQ